MKKSIYIFISLLIIMVISCFSPLALQKFNCHSFNNADYCFTVSTENKRIIELSKEDYIVFGKMYDKPILWKVLNVESDKILIGSEYIICFKEFDKKENGSSDTDKFGSSVWKSSTLKEWLNSKSNGFLCDKNFSVSEKTLISEEGVFLFNSKEANKFSDIYSKVKTCTPDAILNRNPSYYTTTTKPCWYWLRSPSSSNNVSVNVITSSGSVYKSLACDNNMGVVPVLYLKTSPFLYASGEGSKEKPYLLHIGEVE